MPICAILGDDFRAILAYARLIADIGSPRHSLCSRQADHFAGADGRHRHRSSGACYGKRPPPIIKPIAGSRRSYFDGASRFMRRQMKRHRFTLIDGALPIAFRHDWPAIISLRLPLIYAKLTPRRRDVV